MRIERVSVEPLDLPLREPFEISLGTKHRASNVLVTVETEDVTGYGEGSPLTPVTGETQEAALATARAATTLLEEKSLADYRSLVTEVRETFPGMVSALFAVETAILDAYCRERGMALSELFGGGPTSVTTDFTLGIMPPEDARDGAARAADRGFDQLKVKTGTSVAADVARVAAVHEGAPDAELTVDANQGWTPKETVAFVDELESRGIDLALVEQPTPAADVTGLARTRNAVSVPIAADEAVFTPEDAIRIVREDAADVINVKLGKSGLLAARDIASIAEAANVELMVGCMLESAIGIHASAHLVSGIGTFSHVDLDGNLLISEDVIPSDGGPTIDISGVGHGVVPNGIE
ncbi:dipeptide epimerase [Haladaptatus sp. W1]|uniref:dipeptide epimerase n=1 Tax=Haladaptatus sp. W1 TaxID=1897478 RepID=UPI000849A8EC|nr:dipeptide epimerase [Haladaptatus sp. W1]ODR82428.1 dipeptide epimerase [Haladaptatus sp. W1]